MEEFGEHIQYLPKYGFDFLYFDKAFENKRPPTHIIDPVEEETFLNYKDFYIMPDAILDPFLTEFKPITVLSETYLKKFPEFIELMEKVGFNDPWMMQKPISEIVPETFAYLKRWEDKNIPIPIFDKDVERYLSEHRQKKYPITRTEIIGNVEHPLC